MGPRMSTSHGSALPTSELPRDRPQDRAHMHSLGCGVELLVLIS